MDHLKMGAPLENTNTLRFKTPEQRRALCEEYCNHLKSGKSKNSFRIRPNTMGRYLKGFPEDFPPDDIDEAVAACAAAWEEIGLGVARGQIDGNASMTIFGLKNISGWRDKVEIETRDTSTDHMTRQQKMLDTAKKIAFILRQGINAQGAVLIPQPHNNIEQSHGRTGQTTDKDGTSR